MKNPFYMWRCSDKKGQPGKQKETFYPLFFCLKKKDISGLSEGPTALIIIIPQMTDKIKGQPE